MQWLTGSLSSWKASAHEKGLDWVEEIPSDLPVIQMDAERMAQAVGNLLSNAVKFTPPGGKITVSASANEGQFVLQVANAGPGIPENEWGMIFQPFYRGSQGRHTVQGMGLGLSIAHDIVKAHGGGIELQSRDGAGSRFTLRIPIEVLKET